ncbi:metal-sulfur cluster assembly factor [Hutsoniella sourekii]|uniref:metal-sulfur cluster assembly factor n=1 Tax=Hutsoniella sourekii TaxID=87650 RepID=UPI000480B632|nr:metal-sulfur cluster assembly factor [Hutsoniella sourekii]
MSDLSMEDKITQQLQYVIDPELGIDIVNLGLIYEVSYDEDKREAEVLMTLTTMGCPLADIIEMSAYEAVTQLDEVDSVKVNLTFDPPWRVDFMSRYARIALGIR